VKGGGVMGWIERSGTKAEDRPNGESKEVQPSTGGGGRVKRAGMQRVTDAGVKGRSVGRRVKNED
jgi:hypothetical protein